MHDDTDGITLHTIIHTALAHQPYCVLYVDILKLFERPYSSTIMHSCTMLQYYEYSFNDPLLTSLIWLILAALRACDSNLGWHLSKPPCLKCRQHTYTSKTQNSWRHTSKSTCAHVRQVDVKCKICKKARAEKKWRRHQLAYKRISKQSI